MRLPIALTKSLSQQGQALGNRRLVVFVSFEFERDVASEVMLLHNPGDARIIQIESVPKTAAIIGLGLHEDRLRGAHIEFVIWIFEKVTRIEQDLQPGRVDRIGDSQ